MKSSLICVCFTWTEVKTKSDRLKRYEIQIRQSLPFRPGRRNKEMVILHENWGWGIGGGGGGGEWRGVGQKRQSITYLHL